MKHATRNTQHVPLHVSDWLHEPTVAEMKEQIALLKSWLIAFAIAMVIGWIAFFVVVLNFPRPESQNGNAGFCRTGAVACAGASGAGEFFNHG